MKTLFATFGVLALALIAALGWGLVYPYSGTIGDMAIATLAVFFVALCSVPSRIRARSRTFVAISAVATLIGYGWSAMAWRAGWWYPPMPRILPSIFGTDGEASYNAFDAQLFVAVWLVLAICVAVVRWRAKLSTDRAHAI